jgi:DNA-binding response OmpR family regulator
MNDMSSLQPMPTILCIDDDRAITTALSLRFRPFDVRVITAYFGEEGIVHAVTDRPDVIITDLRMPQGQGDYVVECLRSRAETKDVPVIVLTGCRDRERVTRMRELGVTHYLQKPITFDAVLDAIRNYIPMKRRIEHQASLL